MGEPSTQNSKAGVTFSEERSHLGYPSGKHIESRCSVDEEIVIRDILARDRVERGVVNFNVGVTGFIVDFGQ